MKITTLLLAVLILLTGCGTGILKSKKPVAVETGDDITRPPVVAKDRAQPQQETNPNEAVSFDEWRKKREEEAKAKAEAQTQ